MFFHILHVHMHFRMFCDRSVVRRRARHRLPSRVAKTQGFPMASKEFLGVRASSSVPARRDPHPGNQHFTCLSKVFKGFELNVIFYFSAFAAPNVDLHVSTVFCKVYAGARPACGFARDAFTIVSPFHVI